jgi:hypothetical protein
MYKTEGLSSWCGQLFLPYQTQAPTKYEPPVFVCTLSDCSIASPASLVAKMTFGKIILRSTKASKTRAPTLVLTRDVHATFDSALTLSKQPVVKAEMLKKAEKFAETVGVDAELELRSESSSKLVYLELSVPLARFTYLISEVVAGTRVPVEPSESRPD